VKDVLDAQAQAAVGIAHARSGELVVTATERAWFAYPYWFDAEKQPDFADCIAVFDKIGTDTCELFLKPGVTGKLHLARRFAQLKAGLKVPFDIVDIDERRVRGARRIARDDPQRRAAVISSWQLPHTGPVPMENLKDLILARMFD
jgi:hypothetical protein